MTKFFLLPQSLLSPGAAEVLFDSFSSLTKLTVIELVNTSDGISFHFAFPAIAEHCPNLEILTIAYDWNYANDPTEREMLVPKCSSKEGFGNYRNDGSFCPNFIRRADKVVVSSKDVSKCSCISILHKCTKLKDLLLLNFGDRSELLQVVFLLQKLKSLKFIYHKEIAEAIASLANPELRSDSCSKDLTCGLRESENSGSSTSGRDIEPIRTTLELNKLSFYLNMDGFGEYRAYISNDMCRDIVTVCPKLRDVQLVAPDESYKAFNLSEAWKIHLIEVRLGENFEENV